MKKLKPTPLLDKLEVASLEQLLALDSESVKEASVAHKLEFIPGPDRIRFMEELWRVLVVGGKVTVIVCYWTSPRAIQDPMLAWPPLCDHSFLYFNKGWRAAQGLSEIKCDFDFTMGYTMSDPEIMTKNTETQQFWIKHYVNTAADMQATLTKRGS